MIVAKIMKSFRRVVTLLEVLQKHSIQIIAILLKVLEQEIIVHSKINNRGNHQIVILMQDDY